MLVNNQSRKHLFNDLSLWSLLFANLITIFLATKEGWNLPSIMWVYWFQSITIGLFNFTRILQLREFSTEGFTINHRPAQPIHSTKIFTAFFFLFHYGFFHLFYLVFLLSGTFNNSFAGEAGFIGAKSILLIAILFFINHLFSFIYNKKRDTKKPNIGVLMFYPYARIIPMHLTIILGLSFGQAALPFFLILKTFSDVVMHMIEHSVIRKDNENTFN